jgi:ferredoxin
LKRIEADATVCAGSGLCAYIAASYFALDEDNLVTVIRRQVADGELDAVTEAARACPTQALRLTDS